MIQICTKIRSPYGGTETQQIYFIQILEEKIPREIYLLNVVEANVTEDPNSLQ